jgi:hypothetical protein
LVAERYQHFSIPVFQQGIDPVSHLALACSGHAGEDAAQ